MKRWSSCSHAERIERWENCQRVLTALTTHQRRKHWDMSMWGFKEACGTIACAAGHCGLDPWFRRKGLKLSVSKTGSSWDCLPGPVAGFFGQVGTTEIFYNSSQRSVGKVIKEVKAYILRLKADTRYMDGRVGLAPRPEMAMDTFFP